MAGLMGIVGTLVSAAGTIVGGIAAKQQADAQAAALEYRAKEEEKAAQEARASGQRQALEQRRNAALTGSMLVARAAASGAGATDPTILNLGTNIAERGEYLALTEKYKGEQRARGLEDQAAGDRWSAAATESSAGTAMFGSFLGAGAGLMGGIGKTLMGGGSSAFGRYSSHDDFWKRVYG